MFRVQFQRNLRRLVSQLYIRDNCHPFKASLLVWVQLPLWVSLSLALRNLSLDPSGRTRFWWILDQVRLCSNLCVALQPCRMNLQQGALSGSQT